MKRIFWPVSMVLSLIFSVGLWMACTEKAKEAALPDETTILPLEEPLTTIAMGSCNRQDQPQVMWRYIIQNEPDLWIWLGDNIYGDSEDTEVLYEKYRQQRNDPRYRAFTELVPVIGIWDDHDYGVNNGGKEFPMKQASKRLMLNFLGVPQDAPVRKREGAYQAYTFGPAGQRVKVVLLDARYFRDPLIEPENGKPGYLPNEEGDILGEAQWSWLEGQLRDTSIQLFLIGSGIQILPEDHNYEKWANFPAARRRLLDLLVKTGPARTRTVLISGDRHLAELSRKEVEGLAYPLYELTASGLTHSYEDADEYNRYRVGDLVGQKNFGILRVDWKGTGPEVTAEVRGLENELFFSRRLE